MAYFSQYFKYWIIEQYSMDAFGLTEYMSSYIIRPPRPLYNITDLGQTKFEFKGIVYQRIDFQVPASENNLRIQGSLYTDKFNKSTLRPTVLYLHANSSNRVSVKYYLKYLIPYFDVVAFDFRGCGKSDGKYLTLGYLEKWDVKAVVEYVDSHFNQRKYILWGRSMGAVTAVLYAAKFQHNSDKIFALILDSPFGDLQEIIYFIADNKLPMLPKFMMGNAVGNLHDHTKKVIKQEYGKEFLVKSHKPINEIAKISAPIFFIGSRDDELVDINQIKQLYEKAKGRKQMQFLDGGHNEPRPEHLKLSVVQFLLSVMNRKKESKETKQQHVNRKKIFSFGLGNRPLFANQEIEESIILDNTYKQNGSPKKNKSQISPRKSKSRPKNQKSSNNAQAKAKARKQNLFKHNSMNILQYNEGSFANSMIDQPSYRQRSECESQQIHMGKQESSKSFFEEILDKLLPESKPRKPNRIFHGIPAANNDLSNGKKSEIKNENSNIEKFF